MLEQSKLIEHIIFLPHLIGIPLNKQSARPIADFMRQFGHCLRIDYPDLQCRLTKDIYGHIKRFERDHDLSRFYQLVEAIHITCLIKDVNFFNKFNRCKILLFCLEENPEFYFKSVHLFSSVESIMFLAREGDSTCGNEIFDLLPDYCGRLASLTIRNANKLNFKFVSSLVRLKRLILRLFFPIEQCEFMQMIRTLRDLYSVDICYVINSTDLIRDELSKFKREVNDCLENEMKRPAIEFKIEIHRRTDFGTFIRYILKEKRSEGLSMVDEEIMFQMCQSVSMKNRFSFLRLF